MHEGADTGKGQGVAVLAGPYDTVEFDPRFTVDLPEGWRVLRDDPVWWRATDGFHPDVSPEDENTIDIVRLAGVTDDSTITNLDLWRAAARHRRPLPGDLATWLRARPEMTTTDLPPLAIAQSAAARMKVEVARPPRRRLLADNDCTTACVNPFVSAPWIEAPEGELVAVLASVANEVAVADLADITLLVMIKGPPAAFAEFEPRAAHILETLRLR